MVLYYKNTQFSTCILYDVEKPFNMMLKEEPL